MSRNPPSARPQTPQPAEAYEPTLEESVQAKVILDTHFCGRESTLCGDGLMQTLNLRYVIVQSA